MPSPLGHALAGVAAGWLVPARPATCDRAPRRPGRALATALGFAALGAAPDLDLLVGAHSRQSHSIGAAVLVALLIGAISRRWDLGLASGAAWASHVLLDWLGTDGTPPIGIMALWPWSDGFYESSVHLFPPIERRWWMEHIVSHNLKAAAWEVLVLLPVLVLVWVARRRRVPE